MRSDVEDMVPRLAKSAGKRVRRFSTGHLFVGDLEAMSDRARNARTQPPARFGASAVIPAFMQQ